MSILPANIEGGVSYLTQTVNNPRGCQIRLRNLSKKEYLILERLTYHSKGVYNNALYAVKNNLLDTDTNCSFLTKLYRYVRNTDNAKFLHAQSVQAILKQLCYALKKKGCKKLHFMPRDSHRSVVWTNQQVKLQNNVLCVPLTQVFLDYYNHTHKYVKVRVPEWLKYHKLIRVTLVPRLNAKYFELHILYDDKRTYPQAKGEHVMGIDLGVSNFATIAISDGTAFIIDGRKAKSVNQWYNKQKARLRSIYDKQGIKSGRKFVTLTKRRNDWMFNFIHQSASQIIKQAIRHRVSKIAIGKNAYWKHGVNIGKKNNSNFVMLPHSKFINILITKAKRYGLCVVVTEEAYTSKVDALALEPLNKQNNFIGKRIKRGLFKSSTGLVINADVNGAINIARKVFGDDPWKSIPESHTGIGGRGRLARPRRIRVA